MNFDWSKFLWSLAWADDLYETWGSPTCPLEPHSHRLALSGGEQSGRDIPKHWVDYAPLMQRSFDEPVAANITRDNALRHAYNGGHG